MNDKRKIEALQHVLKGKISVDECSLLLERSPRTIYRLLERFTEKGLEGIIHGNRGKPSPHRMPIAMQMEILNLVQGKYADINDTHLSELLARNEKILIGRESLRKLLRTAGVQPKKKRRSPKFRSRRERKPALGMMLQIDASPHDWLEGRGPWMTLVGAKDDATGYVWAKFSQSESCWAYLELMEDVFLSFGLPMSLYSDRHTIFHIARDPTILEELKGIRPLTQFGRSMNDLGIQLIKAWSPQAKGRIERLWGVLQDRLVVEMRLAQINNLEQANEFLKTFLATYNAEFTIAPKQAASVFRKAPSQAELDHVLCLRDQRVVNKDHTISFEGLVLQIPPSKYFHSLAKKTVDVLQLKDGHIDVMYQKRVVASFRAASVTKLIQSYVPDKTELRLAA